MTKEQEAAIRAVLHAAPAGALRRVLRQPVRLWRTDEFDPADQRRCLADTLEDAYSENGCQGLRNDMIAATDPRGQVINEAAFAFEEGCATDGLPGAVAACKRLAREEMQRRG